MTAAAILAALREAVSGRPAVLARALAGGTEVVGYFSPLAPPTEILEAAGALPWRLLATGGADADLRGMGLLGRDTCSFCRSVVGQALVTPPPISAVATGTVCDRLRRAADALPDSTGLPLFSLALPRTRENPRLVVETARELRQFAEELSARTGMEATPERLRASVLSGNRVRAVLVSADAARRAREPRLTGLEFFDVVRAAHGLDTQTFLSLAEELPAALADRPPVARDPVRILLAGPTIADGQREVVEFAEGAGRALVVADVTDSGSLGWGEPVDPDEEPFAALAAQVLAHPLLAAPTRPADPLRAAFSRTLEEARPDGVIHRGVPFCRPWNSEAVPLRALSPVPFLDLRADGGGMTGQLRTRVEAFVEMLKARRRGGRP